MLGQRFLLEISFILRPLLPFPTPILSGILNYKISCFETNWNGRNCFGNNSRRYYILIVCHIWDAVKKSPKGFKLLQLNPQIPLVSAFVCIYGNHYLDQQQSCFTSHCLLKYIFEYPSGIFFSGKCRSQSRRWFNRQSAGWGDWSGGREGERTHCEKFSWLWLFWRVSQQPCLSSGAGWACLQSGMKKSDRFTTGLAH